MWTKWQDEMPPVGTPVICRIYPGDKIDKLEEAELIHVNADDHTWVVADDLAQFNEWGWTVVDWLKQPS